jgi:hypothetical protein
MPGLSAASASQQAACLQAGADDAEFKRSAAIPLVRRPQCFYMRRYYIWMKVTGSR